MHKSILKRSIYIFILILSSLIFSDDFSEGPYVVNYFDVAAPFELPDLNLSIQGDANLDENINIQDIILVVGQILGTISLSGEQLGQADVNSDNIVDILDIVSLVGFILHPEDPVWSFEQEWTGND